MAFRRCRDVSVLRAVDRRRDDGHEQRDDDAWDEVDPRAALAHRDDDRGDHERAERDADISADGEERHAGRALGAGNEAGRLRCFGMEDRRSDTRDGDGREHVRIRGRYAEHRKAAGSEQHAERDEKALRASVGDHAEHRLGDGRRDLVGGGDRGEQQIREREFALQVRQHSDKRAARDVHAVRMDCRPQHFHVSNCAASCFSCDRLALFAFTCAVGAWPVAHCEFAAIVVIAGR